MGCPRKKLVYNFLETGLYFPKVFLNSKFKVTKVTLLKLVVYPIYFKKKLGHMAQNFSDIQK